jgi:L-fuconolactonase
MAEAAKDFLKRDDGRGEPVLEPELPIIDAHHHLFDRPALRYLLEDYLAHAKSGHRIIGTVYIETQAMARRDGPEALRPIGEIEFALGVGAMCDSGVYGSCRVAAGIVGFADMTTGERIAETLDRAMTVAPERFRGVRQIAIAHPDPSALRFLTHKPPPNLLNHPDFLAAFRQRGPRGLTFDATVLHHQLPEVAALADRHPDTSIILGHLGLAMAMDGGSEERAAAFRIWRENMADLALRPNVFCKVGGLGTAYWGFGFNRRSEAIGSEELAAAWQPYVETAVELFGARRCMAESNFPNDGRSCGFVPLWNALKRIAKGCSADEKAALFHRTAAQVYRLDLEGMLGSA